MQTHRNKKMDTIIRCVADRCEVSVADMMGKGKAWRVAVPRAICYYLGRALTDLSYPQIAYHLNRIDHTTAFYGERRIERLRAEYPHIDAVVYQLWNEISETLNERAAA